MVILYNLIKNPKLIYIHLFIDFHHIESYNRLECIDYLFMVLKILKAHKYILLKRSHKNLKLYQGLVINLN